MLDSSPEIGRVPLQPEGITELREQFRSPGAEALTDGREVDLQELSLIHI